MARVQLALNVSNLDRAVEFYSKLFSAEPAKRRPGYANFAIVDPPLKLVLLEATDARASGAVGALNHLGIEVEGAAQVREETTRFTAVALEPRYEQSTTCCYAEQEKVWVRDPDGEPWEVYAVLADAPTLSGPTGDDSCCAAVVENERAGRSAMHVATTCC